MIALDLLSFALVAGLLVLVVSTTVMVMGMMSEQRKRPRRAAQTALHPSAAQAVALARKRADAARAELVGASSGVRPTGQIIDITDGHDPDRDRAVDEAIALALQVAETDPQRIAEVIRAWIRADLSSSAETWEQLEELVSPPV